MNNLTLTPHLVVNDGEAAISFYEKAFGAALEAKHPADDGKRLMHCSLRINGNWLFMSDSFPEHGHPFVEPRGFNLHLQVDDANLWWNRAVAAAACCVASWRKSREAGKLASSNP